MTPAPQHGSDDIDIDVAIEDERWREIAALDEVIRKAVRQTLAATGVRPLPAAELSLLLCDDEFIAELNAKWRGRNAPTNVLSFPAGGAPSETPILGDIIIAFETTAREAAEEGKPLADHFAHLVVHGLLHLIGYDHETDAEAEEMEALERDILAALGVEDPYRGSIVEGDRRNEAADESVNESAGTR